MGFDRYLLRGGFGVTIEGGDKITIDRCRPKPDLSILCVPDTGFEVVHVVS